MIFFFVSITHPQAVGYLAGLAPKNRLGFAFGSFGWQAGLLETELGLMAERINLEMIGGGPRVLTFYIFLILSFSKAKTWIFFFFSFFDIAFHSLSQARL